MTANSAEITFECSQCGQRISVDSSGAGLSAECPTCQHPLVIPTFSSLHDRSYGEAAAHADRRTAFADGTVESSATELQDLRDELAEARQRGDAAGRAHTHADKENAQLQQQLGEARAVISQLGVKLAAVEENRTEWEQAFAHTAEQAHAYETQLTARETDFTAALAAARAETGTLAGELAALRTELEDTHAAFRATTAAAEEKRAEMQRALESAEAEHLVLIDRLAGLRVEAETLRSDLAQIHTGRELLALRDRFNTLETEHRSSTAALARSTAEVEAATASAEKLRADLTEARERGADAERRADAASESALKRDNEVLRGIIERQNTVGEERYAELRRLRRQRLTLRLLYAGIALGVIGCVALAIDYLPGAVQRFLHEWFGL